VNIFSLQELKTNDTDRFTSWVSSVHQEQQDSVRIDAGEKRVVLKLKGYKTAVEFPNTATVHQNILYVKLD